MTGMRYLRNLFRAEAVARCYSAAYGARGKRCDEKAYPIDAMRQ